MMLDRQKWHDNDPNLSVNDIVYFKLDDSPLKIDWRVGKVEVVKSGRDGKVREVSVAYKIVKDERWSHSVVTRPAREIIKLFELNDTSFAEDMIAVQKAAKEILIKRGSLVEDDTVVADPPQNCFASQNQVPRAAGSSPVHSGPVSSRQTTTQHQPFFTCASAASWFQYGDGAKSGGGGEYNVQGGVGDQGDQVDDDKHFKDKESSDEEVLFLI